MSNYSYLDDFTKNTLNRLVEKSLKNISMSEPPVRFDDLFEQEALDKHLVSSNEVKSLNLIEKLDGKILKNLKGLLSVKDKQVYIVGGSNYQKRINFIQSHEYAHWIIPSHKKLLYKCTQFDLSRAASQQLEQQANYFASELGFMQGLFLDYLQSSELSMRFVKNLSNTFEYSVESTLWRTVEVELRPCALISFNINENDEERYLSIRYVAHSKPFEEKIGKFDWRYVFSVNSGVGKYVFESRQKGFRDFEGETVFKGHKLKMEFWYNGFNLLALCKPIL